MRRRRREQSLLLKASKILLTPAARNAEATSPRREIGVGISPQVEPGASADEWAPQLQLGGMGARHLRSRSGRPAVLSQAGSRADHRRWAERLSFVSARWEEPTGLFAGG